MTDIHDPVVNVNSKLIYEAIQNMRYVTFVYDGFERRSIPCCLGEGRKGKVQVRCWQESGGAVRGEVPGWKLHDLAKIKKLCVLKEKFTYIPTGYNPLGDSAFAKIFVKI